MTFRFIATVWTWSIRRRRAEEPAVAVATRAGAAVHQPADDVPVHQRLTEEVQGVSFRPVGKRVCPPRPTSTLAWFAQSAETLTAPGIDAGRRALARLLRAPVRKSQRPHHVSQQQRSAPKTYAAVSSFVSSFANSRVASSSKPRSFSTIPLRLRFCVSDAGSLSRFGGSMSPRAVHQPVRRRHRRANLRRQSLVERAQPPRRARSPTIAAHLPGGHLRFVLLV